MFALQADDPSFACQRQVYKDIGEEMLLHAFEGTVNQNLAEQHDSDEGPVMQQALMLLHHSE